MGVLFFIHFFDLESLFLVKLFSTFVFHLTKLRTGCGKTTITVSTSWSYCQILRVFHNDTSSYNGADCWTFTKPPPLLRASHEWQRTIMASPAGIDLLLRSPRKIASKAVSSWATNTARPFLYTVEPANGLD